MIAAVIAALISNYMTTCFVLGLVVAAVQVLRRREPRDAKFVSGILLNNFIFYGIGCAQAVNFVMHSVFGDYAARTIGWAQSPFQLELAFSSLGVAVMAFIVHSYRSQFRGKLAVVLATAIFAYGAAGGHVFQMLVNQDFAANNTGLLLVMDIFIPTFGLAVATWHSVARQHNRTAATDAQTLPMAAAASNR